MPNQRVAYNSLVINQTGANTNIPVSTISASGNISGLSIIAANSVIATGNIRGGNILSVGQISVTGNITGGNLRLGSTGIIQARGLDVASFSGYVSAAWVTAVANLTTQGFVTATGNITGGNIRTAGAITATGNIAGNYILGNGSQLTGITSQLSGSMSGNINANNFSIAGANSFSGANLLVTTANVLGTLTVSGGKNVVVSNVARQIWISNLAPTSGQGAVGDIWYQTV